MHLIQIYVFVAAHLQACLMAAGGLTGQYSHTAAYWSKSVWIFTWEKNIETKIYLHVKVKTY